MQRLEQRVLAQVIAGCANESVKRSGKFRRHGLLEIVHHEIRKQMFEQREFGARRRRPVDQDRVFQLPAGYRPAAREIFAVIAGNILGRVDVAGNNAAGTAAGAVIPKET